MCIRDRDDRIESIESVNKKIWNVWQQSSTLPAPLEGVSLRLKLLQGTRRNRVSYQRTTGNHAPLKYRHVGCSLRHANERRAAGSQKNTNNFFVLQKQKTRNNTHTLGGEKPCDPKLNALHIRSCKSATRALSRTTAYCTSSTAEETQHRHGGKQATKKKAH